MALFVDIDDTLILYDLDAPNPYGVYFGTPFLLNRELIENIWLYYDECDDFVVIWSGGGKEYAEMWGKRLSFPEGFSYMTKDKIAFELVKEGDIVIDDQPIAVRTHNPFEWYYGKE